MSRISRIGLALLVVALGCGDDATAPYAQFILKAVTSTDLEGIVGSAVPGEPTVLVTDRAGHPLANVNVRFEVVRGHDGGTLGSIARRDAVTNGEGIASAGEWTLSTTAGKNLLQVTTYGAIDLMFRAEARPDKPFALGWQRHGADEVGFRGMTVRPPAIQVRDRFGNSIAGVAVNFAVTAGGGTLDGSQVITTDGGAWDLAWTLGTELGANTITASALELQSIDFTVHVVDPSAVYDLTMIDGGALHEHAVESGFIGFTADGHFVSQQFTADWGLITESGVFERNGSLIVLTYSTGYHEVGTLIDGVLLLDRWTDDDFSRQWQYEVRN